MFLYLSNLLLNEVESYGNLELLARQVVEGFITGLHKSPFHGFSVEFAEHRQYNPGESTRNIDWKLFGRTDRLYVKRFEEETNLRCRILLDVSGSMYYPEGKNSKLRFSVLAAASIANLLKKQRDAFGLTTFQNSIIENTQIRSNALHFNEIINKLQGLWESNEAAEKKSQSNVSETLEYIAGTAKRRNLLVIFSDMFDSIETEEAEKRIWNALQQLRFLKNEIILFHVQHKPEEGELEFPSKPMRFEDIETGEKIVMNPAEIKQEYQARMALFQKNIQTKCLQHKIDFYSIDVSKDFHQVLLPFYIKRMRMA